MQHEPNRHGRPLRANDHLQSHLSRVARMARFGVRSGSVACARSDEDAAKKRFERTGANGRARTSLALAMQKVAGSSPIIRFLPKSPAQRGFSVVLTGRSGGGSDGGSARTWPEVE